MSVLRVTACLGVVVVLLSGCFGNRPSTTPVDGLSLSVEDSTSPEGYRSYLVTPREGAPWRLLITPWSDRVARIEFRTDGEKFHESGLSAYAFLEAPVAPPVLDASGFGQALKLQGGGLTIIVQDVPAGPMVTLNGRGPFFPASSGGASSLRGPAEPEERFYGMGEVFSGIEHRGKSLTANLRYGTNDGARLSANPFYMSSAGYGVLIDTTYATNTTFATKDHPNDVRTTVPEAELRAFLFDGPRFTTILQDYANITGKAHLPPAWMFGYIQSKFGYFDRQQLEEVANRLRSDGFPADGLVLDYYWRQNARMQWVEPEWPLHAQMLDGLHAQGFHVVVHEDTEQMRFYPDAPAGYRYATERSESPGLQILDVSNRGAVSWYWSDLHRPLVVENVPGGLFKGGVDGFWIDEIDWAPETGTQPFANGMLPAEMHNLYANLFTRAVGQPFIDDLDTRPALITRSYWTGGQRFPHAWSGDTNSDFGTFERDLHAGISMGLSGFPFWGDDLGGFWGKPNDELHVRWAAQFGAFGVFMRVHGTGFTANMQTAYQTREPWDYSQQAQDIFRDYDKMRYRMLPYIYSLAHDASRTGLPILRALVVDYQDDPAVAELGTEYLYGPAFLVAPVFKSGGERSVYLPAGTWYDYWTDARLACPCNFTWKGDLTRFPVYVKAGAIVTTGPDMSYVGERPVDPLTVDVWPQAAGSFRLIEDDGKSLDYESGGVAERSLAVTPTKTGVMFDYPAPSGTFKTPPRKLAVVFHDVEPTLHAFINGQPTDATVSGRTLRIDVPSDVPLKIELLA